MKIFLMLSVLILSFNLKAEDLGIKSKDLKNQELNPNESTNDASADITPAQAEDLKKQIEKFKENQKKSQAILEELDKE